MKFTSACFKLIPVIIIVISAFGLPAFSQYNTIPISGFNHDVVAEAGTSSLTTTTIPLDGDNVSNKVIYTETFKNLNSFGGGGLPDNGLITGVVNYQLADYTSNNVLLLQRNQNGDINLNTTGNYVSIGVLCFSTEGSSLINATLFFTDGSQTTALTNYAVADWFNNTSNLVVSGFGRCTRSTPASGADAYPGNPRMYYIEIPLSCADQKKSLQKINFANVTTAGSNAPYPNFAVFAFSGKPYFLNLIPLITNATCSGNGSFTFASILGTYNVYGFLWNTVPPQNGAIVTDVPEGTYTAIITDPASCISTYSVTVGFTNDLSIITQQDTTICTGASFDANIISNATAVNWSPATGVSDPAILNPVLSPTVTTTYTITGTMGSCNVSKLFTVTVTPPVVLNMHIDTSICLGATFNSNISGNATSYSWSPTTGVSDPSIADPILSPAVTTTYTVTATTGNCSTVKTFIVNVVADVSVSAGNDVTVIEGQSVQLHGSGSAGTYLWTPAAGLSATNIPDPIAKPATTSTYTLRITSANGCTGTDNVDVIVVPYCVKAMEVITPNGDGINDKWLVTNGNCISNASVHVYNRYGSPVYENKDYKNDWEGTYKGKPVPDATYYFVIEYKLLDRRVVTLKGNLTIIR